MTRKREDVIAEIVRTSYGKGEFDGNEHFEGWLAAQGYTLAPLEPTEAMIQAGSNQMPCPRMIVSAYKAMLAAQEAE